MNSLHWHPIRTLLLLWASVFLCLSASLQAQTAPAVSDQPLTADQIAVYRALLTSWLQGDPSSHGINLSELTTPLATDQDANLALCLKGLALEPITTGLVHRFAASDAGQMNVRHLRLVNPDRQREEVSRFDPGKAIRQGVSIEEALRRGFDHGLFQFSEIRFDSNHTHALLSYGFHCGGLCGNGATIILEKQNGVWRTGKSCSIWNS